MGIREKQLNVRLSKEEEDRLRLVAEYHGFRSDPELVRWLLRREERAIKIRVRSTR